MKDLEVLGDGSSRDERSLGPQSLHRIEFPPFFCLFALNYDENKKFFHHVKALKF